VSSFPREILELLDRTKEVDIETRNAQGAVHRVPIWVVVSDGEVLIRSWRGSQAGWYRRICAREGALIADGRRIPIHAVSAVDADSVRRTSDGFRRKYPTSKSTPAMVRDEVLDTTLRLEPPA